MWKELRKVVIKGMACQLPSSLTHTLHKKWRKKHFMSCMNTEIKNLSKRAGSDGQFGMLKRFVAALVQNLLLFENVWVFMI